MKKASIEVLIYFCAFVLFFVVSFSSELLGEPVSSTEASGAVMGWLKVNPKAMNETLASKIGHVSSYTDIAGQAAYYIVALDPEGFVIVSGDDVVEPIIGFASKGSFQASDRSPLYALVESELVNRVSHARMLAEVIRNKRHAGGNLDADETRFENSSSLARNKWDKLLSYNDSMSGDDLSADGLIGISDVRVAPLVVSTWDQATVNNIYNGIICYNYYTPNNYYCGCVATSMAQLMRYHEHPVSGVGTPTFTIYINNSPQYNTPLRGGDGSGGAYQWGDMPLQPDSGITDAQCQAIGALCYDAGVSVNMNYKSSGSSASLWDTRDQLVSTFGYSNAIRSGSPTLGSSLSDMLNTNMDASLPVLLGVRGTGGHAIICDGYGYNSSTLYHHMNMGWSGDDNAWYQLPIVDAYFYYDSMDTAVYNIYTSGTGEIISGRVTDMSGNPLGSVTVTAEASGGSSYEAATNDNGIYALVNLPSGTSFTVSAEKNPHLFVSQNASTLTSNTGSSSSGNVWGVDFVSMLPSPPVAYNVSSSATSGDCEPLTLNAIDDGEPNPPAVLSYEIISLPKFGTLTDPLAGAITSVPYTLVGNGNEVEYCPCSYFVGSDSFDYTADDGGDVPNGGDSDPATVTVDVNNIINVTYEIDTNLSAEWPMYTYYEDSRTQVIYLPADLGGPQTITDLALNVYDEPGQVLNNWTIRMKHTTEDDYSGPLNFETTGWTVVYQSDDVISSTGWHNFHFDNEFEYDGVRNLLVDFSHNNSFYTFSGLCRVSDTGVQRVLLAYADSDHGDPMDWSADYNPGLYVATAVPNMKLISKITAEKIVGDFDSSCKVDFFDYGIFASAWQTVTSDGDYNENCDIANPAGLIDEGDLAAFALSWLDSLL